jgi:5-methyltetrahydropteroyltriglutamate--homocysteine methyltransferase
MEGRTREQASAAAPIPPLAVMGIGSWPRPGWMLQAMHEHREGRLADADFEAAAEDAVRLAVGAQIRSGVDVVTDGEQRRDNAASFMDGWLDNCRLIPLPVLRPFVAEPETFASELQPRDVPATEVRHPAVVGPLGRRQPLAAHEHAFVRTLTGRPVKMNLPGPYLLTRLMWVKGIADRVYRSCEHLAEDVVRVLREELHALLAAGVALVQLDEPVLSGAVLAGARHTHRCTGRGLGDRGAAALELAFARRLLDRVLAGLPRERLALHVCRGDFTPDEQAALAGDYRPLLPLLAGVGVGTLFLELSTPRAGELDVLRDLAGEMRIGVGVVDQKRAAIEPVAEIAARARRAVRLLGDRRVLLTPDCGFATFASRPAAPAGVAEAKLRALVEAAELVRRG